MSDQATMTQPRGEKMFARAYDILSRGGTVYFTTQAHCTKLTAKHLSAIRCHDRHCQVRFGKRWDIMDWCGVTATL